MQVRCGVAIDGRGRALVMWLEARESGVAYQFRLAVAARGRTGDWDKPKIICGCSSVSALAMNPSGLALVVWSPNTGGLWDETRSPSGRWSARQRISPSGTGLYYMPLALNSRGAAVVAWLEVSPQAPEGELTIAVRPARGRFGRPQTIGGDAYWGWVLAMAPTGEAVVVWEDAPCCMFAMARRPGASSFSSPQTLSPGLGQTVPEALAMDAHGNALALWARSDKTDGHLCLHAAQRPAGGSLEAAKPSKRPRSRADRVTAPSVTHPDGRS